MVTVTACDHRACPSRTQEFHLAPPFGQKEARNEHSELGSLFTIRVTRRSRPASTITRPKQDPQEAGSDDTVRRYDDWSESPIWHTFKDAAHVFWLLAEVGTYIVAPRVIATDFIARARLLGIFFRSGNSTYGDNTVFLFMYM